jgi:hypothetical protein
MCYHIYDNVRLVKNSGIIENLKAALLLNQRVYHQGKNKQ